MGLDKEFCRHRNCFVENRLNFTSRLETEIFEMKLGSTPMARSGLKGNSDFMSKSKPKVL